MIYFISDGQYTKIGVADNPEKRLMELQTGNARKLELLTSINGSYGEERKIHSVLNKHRVLGEWFEIPIIDSEELVYFIMSHYESPRPQKSKPSVVRDEKQVERWRVEMLNYIETTNREDRSYNSLSNHLGVSLRTLRVNIDIFPKLKEQLDLTDDKRMDIKKEVDETLIKACQDIHNRGKKITKKGLSEESGISRTTIYKKWVDENFRLKDFVEELNSSVI